MKRLAFHVELLSDVVITKHSGTTGGQETLDYIPGHIWLGVVAKHLYETAKSKGAAWSLFHSGDVRFGNAYPVSNQQTTWPIPLSIHVPKMQQKSKHGEGLDTEAMYNLVWKRDLSPDEQPKQERAGYFSLSGTRPSLSPKMVMKTAIDRDKGRARESHLYGMETLPAGSVFAFEVHLDDAVAQWDKDIANALTDPAVYIGRSRSAEFGRVRVYPAEPIAIPSSFAIQRADTEAERRLVFYCASDLALLDPKTGQPTLIPQAQHFHLAQGELDLERTFLMTRRYSPFNGTRKRPEAERQVLTKGSVIVFKNIASSVDLNTLSTFCATGIGLYREAGLGQILVQPSFLQQETLYVVPTSPNSRHDVNPSDQRKTSSDSPIPVDVTLLQWMEHRSQDVEQRQRAAQVARDWIKELQKHRPRGRGPSRSQWGYLRDCAAQAKDIDALVLALFGAQDAQPDTNHTPGSEIQTPAQRAKKRKEKKENLGQLFRGVRQEYWATSYRGKTLAELLAELIQKECEAYKHSSTPFSESSILHASNQTKDAGWHKEVALKAVQILAAQMPKHLSREE